MPAGHEHRYALPPGYRLGEYRVERYLGSGGFGITYLAIDENLNLRVAIKEYLPSDLALREADNSVAVKSAADRDDFEWGRERFLDEARSLARFNHPNIVRVQRFLEAHGTSYIVMDYVEGEPLSELLKRKGTLTEAEVRRSVLPLADGLAAIHVAGLLHRDIKPSNIVIRDDGVPVLIDFGSARQAVGVKSRSVTSVVTPGYAPLEQYATRSPQGPATDIYAFGAVLYRCVTGVTPDDATERAIEDRLTPAAQAARGGYSSKLLATIDAALALSMEERPSRMATFLSGLDNAGHGDAREVGRRYGEPIGTRNSESTVSPVPQEVTRRTTPSRYALVAFGLPAAASSIWLAAVLFGNGQSTRDSSQRDNTWPQTTIGEQSIDQIESDSASGIEAQERIATAVTAYQDPLAQVARAFVASENPGISKAEYNAVRFPGEHRVSPGLTELFGMGLKEGVIQNRNLAQTAGVLASYAAGGPTDRQLETMLRYQDEATERYKQTGMEGLWDFLQDPDLAEVPRMTAYYAGMFLPSLGVTGLLAKGGAKLEGHFVKKAVAEDMKNATMQSR